MTRAKIAGWAFLALFVLVGLGVVYRLVGQHVRRAAVTSPSTAWGSPAVAPTASATSSTAAAATVVDQGFLYGRITTVDGATFEGRLRFGRDEEAFWGDYFNGRKGKNPWAAYVAPERLPKTRGSFEIFGIEIPRRQRPVDLARVFMARFGDIARIEARGRNVQVTLKSGTAFDLDRLEASDFDDPVSVWDRSRGAVELDSLRIRTIELLPTVGLGSVPSRLHGTVHTQHGDFTGFIQWDREKCVGTDELEGRTANGALDLRFDTIRSIARRSPGGAVPPRLLGGNQAATVTLLDGREVVLSKTQSGDGNHGMYVDDRRYGRVLVSWDAFERLDFTPAGSGPAYGDFPLGRPLAGTVTTRDGRRLTGRLVYDLDESETTETLDASSQGVDYTIPFGLIASIALPGRDEGDTSRATVTLHDGEQLQLERTGDLGEGNAGLLIFADGRQRPEYLPWTEIEQVDFDRPAAMYPPLAELKPVGEKN